MISDPFIWYLISDTWYLTLDIWDLRPETWDMKLDIWYSIYNTRYLMLYICYSIYDTRYLILDFHNQYSIHYISYMISDTLLLKPWYLHLITCYLLLIIGYLLEHAFLFFLYGTGYLKLAFTCKKIVSFRHRNFLRSFPFSRSS